MLDLRATGEDVNRQDTVYVRVAAILIVRINRLCLQRRFFQLSNVGRNIDFPNIRTN